MNSQPLPRTRSRVRWMVLFACAFLGLLSVNAAEKPLPFDSEITAFKSADSTNPPPAGATLFIGSSSIRFWRTLSNDFAGHAVLNRGFGGSQISDVLLYPEEIVFPYKPRVIVFYCGGNDINAGKTPERVFRDFMLFAGAVRETLPGTKLFYISIAPNPARFSQVPKILQANRMIEGYCHEHRGETEFIDIYPLMLNPDGNPRPELYGPDRLHMSPAGYALWARVVRKAVFKEE